MHRLPNIVTCECNIEITVTIGGGDSTPIGHWRSSFKTGTPTISFGVSVFESKTGYLVLNFYRRR